MLQAAASSANRAAVPSWRSAAAVLFVSAVLLASTAHAQTRAAAVGPYRVATTQFFIDGNFDSVPDATIEFGGPMRQQIINAVAAYPSATAADRLNRARTAVYLTVSSPRFQTEY